MKHLNFGVTRMKRFQVEQLIINYHYLFLHLFKKKNGPKRVTKRAKPRNNQVTYTIPHPVQPIQNPNYSTALVPRPELSAETLQHIANMPPGLQAGLFKNTGKGLTPTYILLLLTV